MFFAHPLFDVNVPFTFEGNPSISIGVIERTQIGDGRTDRRDKANSVYPPQFVMGVK